MVKSAPIREAKKESSVQPNAPWWLAKNGLRVLQQRYFQQNLEGEFIEDLSDLLGRVCENQAHIDGLWGIFKHSQTTLRNTRPDQLSDEDIALLKTPEGQAEFGWNQAAQQAYESAHYEAYMRYRREMDEGLYLPATPILLNSGARTGMLYSCFVIPMDDTLMRKPGDPEDVCGIFDTVKAVVAVQKSGGGTGVSVSRTRPRGGQIFGGDGNRNAGIVIGHSTGSVNWLEEISDAVKHIEQGSARHGANMGILRVDHPDIIEFILVKDGVRLRNFNISVAVTDRFLDTLKHRPDAVWMCDNPYTKKREMCFDKLGTVKKPSHSWTVQEIWDLIIDRAYASGDPGLWFIDRVNSTNPTPNCGCYEACNPCGEQPLLPNESCNLGSIVLSRFIDDGPPKHGEYQIDWVKMERTIRTAIRHHDAVIDSNVYTVEVPAIRRATKATRKIGLGVMGWWDLLVKLGIPYDSDEAIQLAKEVMGFINKIALKESQALAIERGTFPAYEGSEEERRSLSTRNATRSTIAPTGTISILANITGGIEPTFGLAYIRDTPGTGGKVEEINATFQAWLDEQVSTNRFSVEEAREILESVFRGESVSENPLLTSAEQRLFKVANEIGIEWHVRHQAAFQQHTDNSVSKTINAPRDATRDDIEFAYNMAIERGLHGITVFRDGCLEASGQSQPMSYKKDERKTMLDSEAPVIEMPAPALAPKPASIRPLRPQIGISMRSIVGNVHLHITVDPKLDRELEVFGCVGKAGDLKLAQMEGMGRLISQVLRLGGTMELVVSQLKGIGSKHTTLSGGGRHLSMEDTVGHMLAKYLEAKARWGMRALLLGEVEEGELRAFIAAPLEAKQKEMEAFYGGSNGNAPPAADQHHGLVCGKCNNDIALVGGCAVCLGCGDSRC